MKECQKIEGLERSAFYHLLAENEDKTTYIAYVSQQNLEKDESKLPSNILR